MLTRSLTNLTDLVLAVWVCAWIALGIAIGVEVSHLSALSDTVVSEGRAVRTVGSSLHSLSGVPLVGGAIASGARAVQAAGASAVSSGNESESTITALSVLLALAVALLPSAPVLLLYAPGRVRRRREAGAIRHALADPERRLEVREFLAQRALYTLGYSRLSRLGV
ncbi:MAG TPA: hypothetical protein VG405_03905, partial [Solirubrobacteraceae bacterium]|nr:hypothetical protein [Solirubrobacteraceae bacterium]